MVGDDEIFVDESTYIYGNRSEWVSPKEVEKIDEIGSPHPMAELELGDFGNYRFLNCPRYDRCLDYAQGRYWSAFSCSRCEHNKETVEDVPDSPGDGYQKDDFGRWFIPRNYRFPNRASKSCECGEDKESIGDDMCSGCRVELEAVMSRWYD